MVEVVHVKTALRAILFTALLIVYSMMYMQPALEQYQKKSTTIAQKRENVAQLETPVLVLCPDPPFKKSFFKQFGKKKSLGAERYFWSFDLYKALLENYNSTAMDVYEKMSYHLGLDWQISVSKIEKYVLMIFDRSTCSKRSYK